MIALNPSAAAVIASLSPIISLALLVIVRVAVGQTSYRFRAWFDAADSPAPHSFESIDKLERAYYWRVFVLSCIVEFVGGIIAWNIVPSALRSAPAIDAANLLMIRFLYVTLAFISLTPLLTDALNQGRTDTLLKTDDIL
jgi:hypothetical protein